MSDNHRPVQAPPPFPPPVLMTARRISGAVVTTPLSTTEIETTMAPVLERRSSLAGNILLVQDDHDPKAKKRAYLLQRKIKASLHGTIRLGFVLKHPSLSESGVWELVPCSSSSTCTDTGTSSTRPEGAPVMAETLFEMVAVKMEPHVKSSSSSDEYGHHVKSSSTGELSALQWIAANDPEGKGHLLSPAILAQDDLYIYTITPYKNDGSLLDYCSQVGRLPENQARFLFRQMLQALETLQRLEICHRNLALENVLLQGNTCTIVNLESALRMPTYDDGGSSSSTSHYLIEPQQFSPGPTNPRGVAPELLRQDVFDGYAVDLWSTAVMLFIMLLGSDVLFDAPVPLDIKFKEICVHGNLRGVVERWNETAAAAAAVGEEERKKQQQSISISDEALDLLQGMLRAEPRDRLTLAQVQVHPWVTAEDIAPPTPLELTSSTPTSSSD